MNARTAIVSLAVMCVWLGLPVPLSAHRLDEYLQATRLSVTLDRVSVEIDLTPGVAIALEVFSWIDTDRDGQISPAEGEAYARDVIGSTGMKIDGQPVPVVLADSQFPAFRDMSLGVGTIRLRAAADVQSTAGGRHQVWYRNVHRLNRSVYLVNALVPDDPQILITGQGRDGSQHEFTLDYRVTREVSGSWRLSWWFIVGLVLASVLTGQFRKKN